jgi:hypothetical protein
MNKRTPTCKPAKTESGIANPAISEAASGRTSSHIPRWAQPFPLQRKLKINTPGDIYEQEADRVAGRTLQTKPSSQASHSGNVEAPPIVHQALQSPSQPLSNDVRHSLEPRIGQGLGDVRVHTDQVAAESATAVNASAYTVGQHVVFGPGQFAPHTRTGQQLLAHELTHVAQQRATGSLALQRDSAGGNVVQMPPTTITSTRSPVERAIPNLGHLRGQGVDPNEMSMERDADTINRNSPDPRRILPFTAGGWNSDAILTQLGQYDTLPGTDSDAIRCVQAVAMASRIPRGPATVVQFLRAMILEGMLSRQLGARQRTAIDVLKHVIGRIETRRATFGDLLWAQEALHDLFYNDVSGTPQGDIHNQLAPTFDLDTHLERLNIWCNNPAEVIAQANRLQPGEQLLVNTWTAILNVAFDQLSDQGIEVAEGGSITVTVNRRRVRIRRIRPDRRPDHSVIDPIVRDRMTGHQLLVFKDGATGRLRLYEPEVTTSGRHLESLAADGSNFQEYFRDAPDVGLYHYIQILGKLTPSAWVTSFAAPTP